MHTACKCTIPNLTWYFVHVHILNWFHVFSRIAIACEISILNLIKCGSGIPSQPLRLTCKFTHFRSRDCLMANKKAVLDHIV